MLCPSHEPQVVNPEKGATYKSVGAISNSYSISVAQSMVFRTGVTCWNALS